MKHVIIMSFVTLLGARRLSSAFGTASSGSRHHRQTFFQKSRLPVTMDPIAFSTAQDDDPDDVSPVLLTPLIVCGPSGVGKGTIIEKYMNELGGKSRFGFTVSHTTRSPRSGEVDGVHYHFTTQEDMTRQIAMGGFLEYAQVHGNLYGTSWASMRDIQENGKQCLLDIDVQGVQNIKRLSYPSLAPKYLFIAPPSLEALYQRLVGRGSESAESLARRTENARAEVQYGQQPGEFDAIVVNDSLEQAVRDFAQAVDNLYKES